MHCTMHCTMRCTTLCTAVQVCGLYLRMSEAALNLREISQEEGEAVVSPEMKEAHNGNLAAVLFWCWLRLCLLRLRALHRAPTP